MPGEKQGFIDHIVPGCLHERAVAGTVNRGEQERDI